MINFRNVYAAYWKQLFASAFMTETDTLSTEELSVKDSGLNMKSRILYFGPFIICFLLFFMIWWSHFSKFMIHIFKWIQKTCYVKEHVAESITGEGNGLKLLKVMSSK